MGESSENGSSSSTSTKEAQGNHDGVVYTYPFFSNFQQLITAVLKCLGLQVEATTPYHHHNPSSSISENVSKSVNDQTAENQADDGPTCQEDQVDDPPSATDGSDPPATTVTDPAADDPPPSSTVNGDSNGLQVSLAAPRRPGTSSGSGPQIN